MYMAFAMVSAGHLPLMMLMLLLAFVAEGQTQKCPIKICDVASRGEGLGHPQFRIPTFQTYKIRKRSKDPAIEQSAVPQENALKQTS